MAGAVISVEYATLTIAADASTDDYSVTGSRIGNTANCIPVVSRFVSTRPSSSYDEDLENYQVDAYFVTGDLNTLRVERAGGLKGGITVYVQIVEFDPARVNVYSDAWTMAAADSSEVIDLALYPGGAVSVVLANTFLVNHCMANTLGGEWRAHLVRSKITDTDTLTFDRGGNSGLNDLTGHWYLAESTEGDFTVQESNVQLSSVATDDDTVTAASGDLDKIFVLGSYKTDTASVPATDNTIDVVLTAGTVTVSRVGTTGVIDWTGHVVTTADGTTVQRATRTQSTATAQDDVTLGTPVDDTMSMVNITGNLSGVGGGSFSGTAEEAIQSGQVGVLLQDSDAGGNFDELRIEHDIEDATTPAVISWEVVEWGTGGGAPARRRVMVIS